MTSDKKFRQRPLMSPVITPNNTPVLIESIVESFMTGEPITVQFEIAFDERWDRYYGWFRITRSHRNNDLSVMLHLPVLPGKTDNMFYANFADPNSIDDLETFLHTYFVGASNFMADHDK